MSTNSLLLPHTTLQSTSFNKIILERSSASSPQSEQMNDKEKVAAANSNEKEKENDDAVTMSAIPKTFAYTLSLLDCSFSKRPFPGIWQLRYM